MARTWIEVSREAFMHNIDQIKHLLGKHVLGSVKLGFVVKSNGYGHGLAQMAQLAQESDALACLFTSNTQEALKVRASGYKKPLVVLAYYNSLLKEVIQHDIDLVCYSQEMLDAVSAAAQAVGKTARVHVKIDTGMSRLGVLPDQAENFFAKVLGTKNIQLVGIMSHCADSASPDSALTARQVASFNRVVARVRSQLPDLQLIHCCSSGSFLSAKGHSVVRVGSNLYGCWKSPIQKNMLQSLYSGFTLRQVLTWKTEVMALKHVASGSAIGYGSTFYAERPMILAFLPIGYAEGYPRALSNRGHVIIKGEYCPVIGIVSMGILAVDVSSLSEVTIGTEVVLCGDKPGLRVDDWAQKTGSLNLDILAHLHPDIKRVIV